MLFDSAEFLIFFALFMCLWPVVRGRSNLRWGYIVAASFVFYGWLDWRFLYLLVAVGMTTFLGGLAMAKWPNRRKTFLVGSVVCSIAALGTFKYLDFFIGNVNWLIGLTPIGAKIPQAGLVVPIGVSFYTFQALSYSIDVYRRELTPTRNVLHFMAYLSMFPKLLAGPIARASDLLPRLETFTLTTETDRWEGLKLITYGYFKKMVVANRIAPIVIAAFSASSPESSGAYWWTIMVMYTMQIYCDFSGYSDIARGLAKWMGYDYPTNFNHPYIASSLADFWSRWHISLSTWFRDYVYIPLGGSRKGRLGALGNMWATMLLSGLWHGEGWTFIVW